MRKLTKYMTIAFGNICVILFATYIGYKFDHILLGIISGFMMVIGYYGWIIFKC